MTLAQQHTLCLNVEEWGTILAIYINNNVSDTASINLTVAYAYIDRSVFNAGLGAITTNQVSLSSSSSFLSDPPTFTLFGDTSGGPPTTYTWTRNGQVITNNATFSISIQVNEGIALPTRFEESHYRSTLTVTGRLPGVYQYSVTNRATPGMVTGTFIIDGNDYYNPQQNFCLNCSDPSYVCS